MTVLVKEGDFSGTRADLQAAVSAYEEALAQHALTVGVPAPWPEHEVIRNIISGGKQYIMQAELPTGTEPPNNRPLTYRDYRKIAYILELGEEEVDSSFENTVGDVLDDVIREIRALAGSPATPEFEALVTKIDSIKARFPKL